MTRAGWAQTVGRTAGIWTPLTSLIGRADDVARLTGLLDDNQLVTVTGPGGVGKTRLANEVARLLAGGFPDGVWFVELSAVPDEAQVTAQVMSALGVPHSSGRPPLEVLTEALAQRRMLLVLDNCEHVLPAVAEICRTLLGSADDLRVLATSRERIGVDGEARYPLSPLELPGTGTPLGDSAAVALFCERARWAGQHFVLSPENAPLVARVVTRLDGMPLAIELAAARVEALGLAGLADRIDDAPRLLTSQNPLAAERHRSLAALADWSYRLLTGPEQRVFRRLAVFPGAFTPEAAEAVAGPGAAGIAARLVDCSLVVPPRPGPDQRTRYSMLQTLHAYGLGRLREAGEEQQAVAALAAYACAVAEQAAAGLATSDSELPALHWLDAEDVTLNRALSWALDHDPDAALHLVTALAPWLRTRGRVPEARERLRTALARSSPANPSWAKARVLLGYASSGNADAGAGEHYAAVIEAHRNWAPSHELVAAFVGLTMRRLNLGNDAAATVADARRALSIARELDDTAGQLIVLAVLSRTAMYAGDAASVLDWTRQAEALLPSDTPAHEKRWCLYLMAMVLSDTGELDAARRMCAAGLALSRRADDVTFLLGLLLVMANIDRRAGNVADARAHLCEAAGVAARNGDHQMIMELVNECGYLCAETGRWADAATLWATYLTDHERYGRLTAATDERDREGYLPRLEQALEPSELRAARERGARMTATAAAELAVMITAPAPEEPHAPGTLLSPRERELVTLVAQGRTNAQIAGQLHISVRTVSSHLDRIRDKTGYRRRADLTRLALEENLV